jgi:cellobiose phosphorylase
VKETGDAGILEFPISWQEGGEATVLEHVKAAIHCLLADKSCSGPVRIYFADLNDALNIPEEEQAEMTRHFRGADYRILIRCGEAKGLSVGGKDIQGDLLPDFRDGHIHTIEVSV